MMKRQMMIFCLLCCLAIGLGQGVLGLNPVGAQVVLRNEPIQPIPLHIELDEKKVELGERLFRDPRLSHDNSMSCDTCHPLATSGTDNKSISLGIKGAEGPINTPTVFNSGFNFRQFWDGRSATLEEQAAEPIHNPKEMGSNWNEVMVKLKNDAEYAKAFNESYPDGLKPKNILDAIATFERSLYTPNSRFDQYLRGDKTAINDEERVGYELFKSVGCIACHQGVGIGGNLYQVFGVMRNYFEDRGNITEADLGRYNLTQNEQDKHVFKVPSLRNVAVTPPYLHDGTVKRLEDMVTVMSKYQLGRKLTPKEADLIVKFLKTLTGEYKGQPLTVSPEFLMSQIK